MTALATTWDLDNGPLIDRAVADTDWVLRPVPDSRPPITPGPAAEIVELPPREPTLFDPPETAADPAPPTAYRLVSVPGAVPPASDLPDPVAWCRTLTPALLEVLQRRRALNQLARWLDDPVLGRLALALRLRQRAGTPVPPRAAVVSLRVQCPAPEVAEVSVHVRLPQRSAALAYRLEAMPSRRWLCTELDLGDAAFLGALPRPAADRVRTLSVPAAAARSARV